LRPLRQFSPSGHDVQDCGHLCGGWSWGQACRLAVVAAIYDAALVGCAGSGVCQPTRIHRLTSDTLADDTELRHAAVAHGLSWCWAACSRPASVATGKQHMAP